MQTRRAARRRLSRAQVRVAASRCNCSTLNAYRAARRAFTLIELLVAIAIFSILVTLSLSAFRETDQDRAAAGAQQLRSMIEGARSRAIHDQQPRGIRLMLDPNNVRTVTSIVYIGAPETFAGTLDDLDGDDRHSLLLDTNNDGFVDSNPAQRVFTEPGTTADDDMDLVPDYQDFDEYGWENSNDAIVATVQPAGGVPGFTTEWYIRENVFWPELRRRKLLAHTGEFVGARIKIPTKSNTWFPIVDIDSPFGPMGSNPHPEAFPNDDPDPVVTDAVRIKIAGQFPVVESAPRLVTSGGTQRYAKVSDTTRFEYVIELAPPVLPGSVPQTLANGVAIDLDGSKIPTSWFSGGNYQTHLDILFSPRGEVIGSAAAAGILHFVIAGVEDLTVAGTRTPNTAAVVTTPQKPERLVTLFTHTGQVTTSQVNRGFVAGGPYEFGLAGKDNP